MGSAAATTDVHVALTTTDQWMHMLHPAVPTEGLYADILCSVALALLFPARSGWHAHMPQFLLQLSSPSSLEV